MKSKRILILALTLAICAFTLPALAEDATVTAAPGDQTITALGNATVTLKPDLATFTVGVSTQETQVSAAQAANAAAMQQVIDALKALGMADEDLQTDNYSVNPVYDYQSSKLGDSQVLKAYTVSNTVAVTVRQLDQLPTLLDTAVQSGANEIYGVSFQSSQTAGAYDQALATAAEDAVRKARLIATALGRTAGDVLSVSEVNDGYPTYMASKSVAYDASAATPIEAGSLSVTASIRVVMALQ